MKKLVSAIISLVLLYSLAASTYAQESGIQIDATGSAPAGVETGSAGVGTKMIAPDAIFPPYNNGSSPFGQKHGYTVTFRGNGDAVVSARLVVGNQSDKDLEKVTYRIPRVSPTDIYVFQIIKQKSCNRYDYPAYDPVTRRYPQQVCTEWAEPDYYNDYSYYQAKYQKADYEFSGDELKITFPTPIESQKAGALFLYFRSSGYAKKASFGAYSYTFESLKAMDSIISLSVGIATDSDLYLKGVEANVNYRFEDVAPKLASVNSGFGAVAMENSSLDSYVSSIGQGSIYKTASNLAPLESYQVEGSYADSRAKLYAKEIMWVGGGVLFVIVLILLLVRLVIKVFSHNVRGEVKNDDNEKSGKEGNGQMMLLALGVGFVASFLTLAYTVGMFIAGSLMSQALGYSFQSAVIVFFIIMSLMVYPLLLFVPGILIGAKKKSIGWGVAVVGSTFGWVFLLGIVLFVVFYFFRSSGNIGIYDMVLGKSAPMGSPMME
ncbi:MAG TPA: hypothetical protein VI819_00065 [Patescibacteria group bacterium]|nr:hypothetical protein [Patescibacteria group bacterium]